MSLPPSSRLADALVVGVDGGIRPTQRAVPEEVPVSLVYSSVPFAVMMLTPSDLEDFAYGFSLTEGIVADASGIREVTVEEDPRGLRLAIRLAPSALTAHLARRRSIAGRTGCGLCGIEELDQMPAAVRPEGDAPGIDVAAIRRALAALEESQPLNDETRAVHAAGFARADGKLLAVREDVGRHNALDKLAGALMRAGVKAAEGFVLVTSRCSFELVEKTASIGARTLVAISAPTALALDRARALDMNLVAVARRDTVTVFHGMERVQKTALG
ncbi:formate dehydrogenase accessory sulfurtransferase FdhD [Roseomonas xinghualingensis]|uniref:formate dehydrogenase accessory sulfurtransferase FdhD n=1 Tax=Roseomonas xinghualingensis TaxID=2986475 RepID=UPI0021F1AF69|nr:formate dehydrogenase accessory sulfurtransferase FdhD [Roseomonas sp. SXEYE001]MCV4207084.1 formate dehydrogenase accessory sulfurtransferase FdhD [Roseomonas sp. SXEYE001]